MSGEKIINDIAQNDNENLSTIKEVSEVSDTISLRTIASENVKIPFESTRVSLQSLKSSDNANLLDDQNKDLTDINTAGKVSTTEEEKFAPITKAVTAKSILNVSERTDSGNKHSKGSGKELTKDHVKSLSINSPATNRYASLPKDLSPDAISQNPLDNMNNHELVKVVENLQKTTRYLELENLVFLHFLEKNDPTLLEGMETVIQKAQTKHERGSICSRKLSRMSRRESSIFFEVSAIFVAPVSIEKEGPRYT